MNQQHERICKLEDQKYDLELFVKRKDFEVLHNGCNNNFKMLSVLLLLLYLHAAAAMQLKISQQQFCSFSIFQLFFVSILIELLSTTLLTLMIFRSSFHTLSLSLCDIFYTVIRPFFNYYIYLIIGLMLYNVRPFHASQIILYLSI